MNTEIKKTRVGDAILIEREHEPVSFEEILRNEAERTGRRVGSVMNVSYLKLFSDLYPLTTAKRDELKQEYQQREIDDPGILEHELRLLEQKTKGADFIERFGKRYKERIGILRNLLGYK